MRAPPRAVKSLVAAAEDAGMPVEKSLREIEDGAILAADVLDSRDNVLLAAGTRLTRAHISLIERRGIKAVKLQLAEEVEQPGDTGPAVDAAALAEALAGQERVFSKVRGQPLMEVIYQAARAHLQAGNLPPGR